MRLIHVGADGEHEYLEYDSLTDTASIKTVQNVEPLLNSNKNRQTDGTHGWTPGRNFRQIAELTPLMQLELDEKFRHKMRPGSHIWDRENQKLLIAILKDSDYRHFRVD